MRLTDAGRAALADGANRRTQAVQLVEMVIGDGTGPGGAADDSRTDLRSARESAPLTGSTSVAGRLAVQADFTSARAYKVTEVGIRARVGASGAAFLFAYWTAPSADDAAATKITDTRLVVSVVMEIAAASAALSVNVTPAVHLGPDTFVALRDTPDAVTAQAWVRGNTAGDGLEFADLPDATAVVKGISIRATDQQAAAGQDTDSTLSPYQLRYAIPVVATESGLPKAPRLAPFRIYWIHDYADTGFPALALAQGNDWDFSPSYRAYPWATETVRGLVRRATRAQADTGADAERYMTPALVERRIDAAVAGLVDGAPEGLDTLAELAAALGNDKKFAATMNAALVARLDRKQVDARIAAALPSRDSLKGGKPAHSWSGMRLRFQNPNGGWGGYVDLEGRKGGTGPKGSRPAHSWSGTRLRFQNPNGTWGGYVDLEGGKGDKGRTGPKGGKPAHSWSGTRLRFQNPNGTWGAYVDLEGPSGNSSGGGTDDPCFALSTLVLMGDGVTVRPVGDVQVGDYLASPDGPREVVALDTGPGLHDTVVIEVAAGGRTLEVVCTPNHRFLTPGGGWACVTPWPSCKRRRVWRPVVDRSGRRERWQRHRVMDRERLETGTAVKVLSVGGLHLAGQVQGVRPGPRLRVVSPITGGILYVGGGIAASAGHAPQTASMGRGADVADFFRAAVGGRV